MRPDPEAFAALICDWCLEVGAAQRVLVESTTLAEPLATALQRAILARDAWPLVRLTPPSLTADFHRDARERHLAEVSPVELALVEAVDALVRIQAPASTTEMADVEPPRIAALMRARGQLRDAVQARRSCGTLVPTPALAQQAGMATGQYAVYVERALFLDRPDPTGAWRELSARQARLVQWLSARDRIRIEAEGTDLSLRVGGRTWNNSDGRRNMPSGEVFTGPIEDSANGTIRFTIPPGPPGVTVSGVQLGFRDGEVVSACAERGQEYLEAALATDEGARRLGEIGIGTNTGIDRPTGHILLDEKMAGTVHIALGWGYPETGSRSRSGLHWDLICDLRAGGRITADGEPLVQDGRLLV